MEEFTKRKIGGDMPQEEQPWPKKSSVVRPSSQGASSFQPWQPSWKKGLGIAEASNSAAKQCLQLQLAIPNSSAAQEDNNMNIEKSTPHHAEKNPIINGGGATSGVGNDDKAAQTDEIQEMDPKLKRTLANRVSARKSRMKKNEYLADLEGKAKSYENKIAALHPQIAAYTDHQRLLLIEQHHLKLQMAAREKERILKEVEIEKNKAEVNRLGELHRKQLVEARARILNVGAAMQLMSNSNSIPPGFGRLICSNSDQAQNGVETSRMQTDTGQQPQNRSQMWWIAKRDNGQRSTPNLNFVKSEPKDQ